MFFDDEADELMYTSLPPAPPSLPKEYGLTRKFVTARRNPKPHVRFSTPPPPPPLQTPVSVRSSIEDRISRIRRRQAQESSLSTLLSVPLMIPTPFIPEEQEHYFKKPLAKLKMVSPLTNNAENIEDEDEDMTVQDEGRPQEEEERMVEETRERLGKTLGLASKKRRFGFFDTSRYVGRSNRWRCGYSTRRCGS